MSRNSYSSWKIILVLSHSESTVGKFRTRGESEVSSEMQARKHESRGSVLALKPMANVTRFPKQGYQDAFQLDVYYPLFTVQEGLCSWGFLSSGGLCPGRSLGCQHNRHKLHVTDYHQKGRCGLRTLQSNVHLYIDPALVSRYSPPPLICSTYAV